MDLGLYDLGLRDSGLNDRAIGRTVPLLKPPQSPHYKGRTVPLLKPPQSQHCYLGEVDHAKNPPPPPPLATRQAQSYRANWATQTLLFSKPFDLAQVCHGNKICSKPALTWKLTLVLAFPAHCLSN